MLTRYLIASDGRIQEGIIPYEPLATDHLTFKPLLDQSLYIQALVLNIRLRRRWKSNSYVTKYI
jgi:hypothetical protein